MGQGGLRRHFLSGDNSDETWMICRKGILGKKKQCWESPKTEEEPSIISGRERNPGSLRARHLMTVGRDKWE